MKEIGPLNFAVFQTKAVAKYKTETKAKAENVAEFRVLFKHT